MTRATEVTASAARTPSLNLVKQLIHLVFQVGRERTDLRHLTPAQLRDIGLTPDQAARETGRAFWDLPVSRR